jgi:hypothetical protein
MIRILAASETPEQKAARKAAKASMDPAAKVKRQNQHHFFSNGSNSMFLFQAEKDKLKALEKAKESKAGGGAAKEKKEKKEKK